MGLLDLYKNLTWIDVVYAAITALVLTNLIYTLRKIRLNGNDKKDKPEMKLLEIEEMKKRCEKLFPIETVYFKGVIFNKGMRVKIITLQKRIIEGTLIGKNNSNVLCVITPNRIIAHDIDKIESLTELKNE